MYNKPFRIGNLYQTKYNGHIISCQWTLIAYSINKIFLLLLFQYFYFNYYHIHWFATIKNNYLSLANMIKTHNEVYLYCNWPSLVSDGHNMNFWLLNISSVEKYPHANEWNVRMTPLQSGSLGEWHTPRNKALGLLYRRANMLAKIVCLKINVCMNGLVWFLYNLLGNDTGHHARFSEDYHELFRRPWNKK